MELTARQQKNLLRLAEMADSQSISLIEEISNLEDRLDNMEELAKGEDGYTPIKGVDYFDGRDGYTPKKGVDYFDGEPGKTPTESELLKLIEPLIPEAPDTSIVAIEASKMALESILPTIPKIDDFKKEIPKINEIRDGLENLPEDEKLPIEAIKDLRKELDELKKKIGGIRVGGTVGGSSSKGTVKFLDLSSLTDGVTNTFSVPKSVSAIIIGSDFPSILMENNGFTLNPTRTQVTLTTANPPSQGSQFLYQYVSFFN